MSLTRTPARSLPRSGAVVAVVLLHIMMFYAINNGLNVATMVKPLESMVAVFVPEEAKEPPKPVERIKVPDAKLSEVKPEELTPLQVEIPPDIPIATDSGAAITAGPQTSAIPETDSFSIKSRVDPQYPSASRRAGEQGTVLLELIVGPDGKPTEVNIARSSGYDLLDQAAVTAVRKWRFSTTGSGYARLQLPVTFRLENAR